MVKLTESELAGFLALPVPRKLPFKVQGKASGGSHMLAVVFGAHFVLFGFAILIFSLPRRPVEAFRLASASLRTTVGTIVGTLVETDRDKEGSPDLREHVFEFFAPDGLVYPGRSFDRTRRAVGDQVDIEFVPADPGTARISGGSVHTFETALLLVSVVPILIGAFIIWCSRYHQQQLLRTLRQGFSEPIAVLEVQETNSYRGDENSVDQRVYRVLCRMAEEAGRKQLKFEVFEDVAAVAEARLEAGEPMTLLIDPKPTGFSVLAEKLMGANLL